MKRRIFISINLNEQTKKHVASKTAALKNALAAKWSRPEMYHLTISFLGHVEDEAIWRICEQLKELLEGFGSFDIKLDCLTWSPNIENARMLWLTGAPNNQLIRLRRAVDQAISGRKAPASQFRPHVTLAKLTGKPDVKYLHGIDLEKAKLSISVSASSVDVMESKQEEGRWEHLMMESIELD